MPWREEHHDGREEEGKTKTNSVVLYIICFVSKTEEYISDSQKAFGGQCGQGDDMYGGER